VTAGRPALTPGVYRVGVPAADAVRALRDGGWDAVLVPPVTSTADLYAALARALRLPSWFGANLDALWDCLTDLAEPTALVLADWTRYEHAEPGQAPRILGLLRDRTRSDPPFAVLLASSPA
jgi:RNAse (barnase) inhibitor barstar